MMSGDDKYFLLSFIMGTYFGPDIKGEMIRKSALQRIAEGLRRYTQEQLSGSQMRTSEMEKIYYYFLRKADKSLAVEIPIFHDFIQGNNPCTEGRDENHDYPKFSTLFPQDLHPQMESLDCIRFIANVIFIRNPAIFYLKPEDDRFIRLTNLEDLFIENRIAGLPNNSTLGEIADVEEVDEEVPIMQYFRGQQKQQRLNEILGVENRQQHLEKSNGTPPRFPYELTVQPIQPCVKQARSQMVEGPGVVVIPTRLNKDELDHIVEVASHAYAVTASEAKGQIGPAIGLMEVGESEDSYLFRVALPVVKRENVSYEETTLSDCML